ncbi:hypothetical protein [Mesorhizobium sp. B2-7-1]|uniref:hypothetical protein n=1 Tax=Mesorhizobium sp. BH1-1-5 TaxID=2876661 RepID=UPI0011297B78|nr:hypothetical protein FJ471_30945 [Mesorhizobium sp. B2-7-1]
MLWIAAKLQSHEREHARDLWAAKGNQAFGAERDEERNGQQRSATWPTTGGAKPQNSVARPALHRAACAAA